MDIAPRRRQLKNYRLVSRRKKHIWLFDVKQNLWHILCVHYIRLPLGLVSRGRHQGMAKCRKVLTFFPSASKTRTFPQQQSDSTTFMAHREHTLLFVSFFCRFPKIAERKRCNLPRFCILFMENLNMTMSKFTNISCFFAMALQNTVNISLLAATFKKHRR